MSRENLTKMRMENTDVNYAFWYAVRAHKGQFRKDRKTPYIEHPVEVAEIVSDMSNVPSVIEAALLHDTVEDTDVRINDIARIFGAYVADLVSDDSENKRHNMKPSETWRVRKEEAIRKIAGAGQEAKMISLADKLSNLRSVKRALDENGEVVWSWFNNSNINDQAWYYRSMRDQYVGLKTTDAWKEYSALIDEIFGCRASVETVYEELDDDISDYSDPAMGEADLEEEEDDLDALDLQDVDEIYETPLDISTTEDAED